MAVSQEKIFVLAAELGSLTEAAEKLGCTQSNASHAISALEKEFGFQVLIRNRQGVKLTREGEEILPWVRAVCEKRDALQNKLKAVRGAEAGKLRLGAFTSVAVHWLPGILKEFQARHPGIGFELLNGDYHDVDEWLSKGEVDAAFIRLPSSLNCDFFPLYQDRLMAILPLDHPKAALDRFPMRAVEGESFISLLESSDHDSIRTLRDAGFSPQVRFTTKDDYALIAMVEKGLGISIVPELLLEGHGERIAALPLDPPCFRAIALATPAGSRSNSAVSPFVAFVEEWAQRTLPPDQPLRPAE